jgi:hypothetical protein
MNILNFGKERSEIIEIVLGEYYKNFDRDVNVYLISTEDEEKIKTMVEKEWYGWDCFQEKMKEITFIFSEIKANRIKKIYFIENIRGKGIFKYLYIKDKNIIIELCKE